MHTFSAYNNDLSMFSHLKSRASYLVIFTLHAIFIRDFKGVQEVSDLNSTHYLYVCVYVLNIIGPEFDYVENFVQNASCSHNACIMLLVLYNSES